MVVLESLSDLAVSGGLPRAGELSRLHQQLQKLTEVVLDEAQVRLVIPVLLVRQQKRHHGEGVWR